MATLDTIDSALFNVQDGRLSRDHLRQLTQRSGDHHHPFSWGHVIFRTVYTPESNEKFHKALKILGIYAQNFANDDILSKPLPNETPHDPTPNQELFRRYYNVVIEDPVSLADASVDEIGNRFDAWIKENLKPGAKSKEPNCRYRYCLMIDQECIDNLLAMSENPNIDLSEDRQQYDRWVKVVSNTQQTEGGRFWLRVGINLFLWTLWFGSDDPDAIIEYVAWPDEVDGVLNYWGQNCGR